MAKTLTLDEYANQIKGDLAVPNQSSVFAHAVEAGYLAARADGNVDQAERDVLVKAVELLSKGAVIEWETETLVDECIARCEKEGVEKRIEAVGAALKELGQPEAGLLVAAFVARATNGVEKAEADTLKAIAKAAGVAADKMKAIVKKATGLD